MSAASRILDMKAQIRKDREISRTDRITEQSRGGLMFPTEGTIVLRQNQYHYNRILRAIRSQ